MIVLLIFAVLCVWGIYSNIKEEKRASVHPVPPLALKSSRRLGLEAVIRKIAGNDVSEEKMDALCLDAPHVLVTARAGTGKTKTIALKVALAIHEGIRPENTLSLCFNRSIAIELGKRIAKFGVQAPTATFHGLAYSIVQPRYGSLLCGEEQRAIMRGLLSRQTEKRERGAGNEIGELVDDMLTFVSSAKHKGLSVDDIRVRCVNAGELALQAASVYAAYEQYLKCHNLIDFDDLLRSATDKLNALERLPVVRINGQTCDLNNLRLLAVDEAQDLSRSFYGIIQVLTEKSPSLQVYAVGDDFQAVNSFAGSDLDFFRKFETYFHDARRTQLRTNYRSGSVIVEHANNHMRGLGEGGVAIRKGGSVEHARISKYEPVHEVVKRLVVGERGRSVLVLARRNVCFGMELETLQKDLSCFHSNVRVSTIHKAKGGEADVVFFLKEPATKSHLSCLNVVLGVTDAEMQAEERRIEYVAKTRPREKLVVIE